MELRGKTALITGVTGLIGGRLAERLVAEEGVQVRGLARNIDRGRWLAERGVELVAGDITDPVAVEKAIRGCHLVFHAAAWVGEDGTREQVWAVNVDGTRNVVNAALAAHVERFVHLSSCAVYGSLQRFNIDETTPTRKRGNLYADSKIEAEEIVFEAWREHGLPVVSARASQVYGPRSYQFTIRPVEVIKAGKMVLIDGGRHFCKPVFIDNLVDGLILCAKVDAAVGEAFNLTDGEPVPWRDFFGAYGRMLGIESFPSVPYPVAWLIGLLNEVKAGLKGKKASLNRKAVSALRSSNSFSNQKARQVLGWTPRVNLDEGMNLTEAWLR
ncbi:MAG: NAD-dependent epimerase/dehydratase family protein, partial [Chloroflexi bacterium]